MSVYKKGNRWIVDIRDAHGQRVRRRYTDRQVAEVEHGKAIRDVERVRAGILIADRREAQRPYQAHVDDYAASLTRAGRDARYIALVKSRLETIGKRYGWRKLSSITARDVEAYLSHLASEGRVAKTINEARSDVHAFCAWAMRTSRMEANPVAIVARTKDTRPKSRGALSVAEVRALLDKAPAERRLVYLLLTYSGLRRAEAAALRWGDVHLDGLNPRIDLRADTTKNGRAESVSLVPLLAEALLAARGGAPDSAPVFRSIPQVKTFRADLRRAGIDTEGERGQGLVLHSLRHSLCTMLAVAGVPMALAQRIMRHSDPRLTARTYTDEGLLPLAAAVRTLPDLIDRPRAPEAAQATGTDGAPVADGVSKKCPSTSHNGSKSGTYGALKIAGTDAKTPRKQGTIASLRQCGRQESNLHVLPDTGT